jgi:hypothetical protein
VNAGEWVLLGSNAWKASWPVAVSSTYVGTQSGTLFVNSTSIVTGSLATTAANINTAAITGVTAKVVSNKLYIYSDGTSAADGAIDSTGADGRIFLDNGTASWAQLASPQVNTSVLHCNKLRIQMFLPFKRSDNTTTVEGCPTGSVWIKTTEPNKGARWRANQWSSATSSWVASEAPIYASTNAALFYLDRSGGGANIGTNTLFVQSNAQENSGFDASPNTAEFRVWYRTYRPVKAPA